MGKKKLPVSAQKETSQQGELPSFLTKVKDGYELRVKVVPGASKNEIVGAYGDRLKIRVAAPPERGKANLAVIKLLRALPHVQHVELLVGESSPEKLFRIQCDDLPFSA